METVWLIIGLAGLFGIYWGVTVWAVMYAIRTLDEEGFWDADD